MNARFLDVGMYNPFYISDGRAFTIKLFDQSDLAAIVAVEQRASHYPWSKKNFDDSIACSHLCVGVQHENIWVAHAVFSLAADEAELLIVAVDPDYQGNRIATAFLTRMERILGSSAEQLFLEVRESNHVAIKMYEALGFNIVGERKNYYPSLGEGGRENAIIYGKYIRS